MKSKILLILFIYCNIFNFACSMTLKTKEGTLARLLPGKGGFSFKLRAKCDAYIVLSSTPDTTGILVKISLGKGNNCVSQIGHNHIAWFTRVKTPGLLRDDDFRGFWISWKCGKLYVGREGSKPAFLRAKGLNITGFSYLGFGTGDHSEGEWILENGDVFRTSAHENSYKFFPNLYTILEFSFRGPSYAEIGFQNNYNMKFDPEYSILLGKENNTYTYSYLAKVGHNHLMVYKETFDIVNEKKIKPFSIHVANGNWLIRLSNMDDKETMVWSDPAPIPFKQIFLGNNKGYKSVWRFDQCLFLDEKGYF